MIRTVADLIRELEDLDNPDAPVRIASLGHRSALSYTIAEIVEEEDEAVYLGEGSQVGYLPSDVRAML